MIQQFVVIYRGGQQLLTTEPVGLTLPVDSKPQAVRIVVEGDMKVTFYTAMEIKRQFELRGIEVREN